MAHAEEEGLTAEVEERIPDEDEELSRPIMPHLHFDRTELDALYPSFNAPPEVDNPDLTDDNGDIVLQHGWKLAEEIQRDMVSLGRTKREGYVRPVTQEQPHTASKVRGSSSSKALLPTSFSVACAHSS